jgi:hypothetical protein
MRQVPRIAPSQVVRPSSLPADDPHSASAAACRRFDNYRKTDLECELFRFFGDSIGSGCPEESELPPPSLSVGLDLIAHHCDNFGSRADKFYIAVFADLCESCRFRQKP